LATVYFLCGMPTSGKTTLAKKLEEEHQAIRFTLDERMIAQYDFSIDDDEYGPLAAEEKMTMWHEGQRALAVGQDIILDWSLWSKSARYEWSQRILDAGFDYKIYYLDATLEILCQRATVRNADQEIVAHFISLTELERFWEIFQPPIVSENLNLEIILQG
jgi:predicted kinase